MNYTKIKREIENKTIAEAEEESVLRYIKAMSELGIEVILNG